MKKIGLFYAAKAEKRVGWRKEYRKNSVKVI